MGVKVGTCCVTYIYTNHMTCNCMGKVGTRYIMYSILTDNMCNVMAVKVGRCYVMCKIRTITHEMLWASR